MRDDTALGAIVLLFIGVIGYRAFGLLGVGIAAAVIGFLLAVVAYRARQWPDSQTPEGEREWA